MSHRGLNYKFYLFLVFAYILLLPLAKVIEKNKKSDKRPAGVGDNLPPVKVIWGYLPIYNEPWVYRPKNPVLTIGEMRDNTSADSVFAELKANNPRFKKYVYIPFKHKHWFYYDKSLERFPGGWIELEAFHTTDMGMIQYIRELRKYLKLQKNKSE